MQFRSFQISKYRGITETKIEIPEGSGARVTTLIGLNESGKTTILEAIYSFSPDPESQSLYDTTVLLSTDPAYYIPRDRFSGFDGEICVDAVLYFEPDEHQAAITHCKKTFGLEIDPSSIPAEIEIRSRRKYETSKQTLKASYWRFYPKVRTGKQKNFRDASSEERGKIVTYLLSRIPRIAYFPTFVFEFPQRIYLKGGPDRAVDRFYRSIFQSVLDAGGEGHTIAKHIVGRFEDIRNQSVVGAAMEAAGSVFLGVRSTQEMIKQTVDKAANTISDVIVSRWDKILSNTSLKKEVKIDIEEEYDGSDSNNIKHDIWIEFKVEDNRNRYNIADRSLGFRWFFCFLLFTRFMPKKGGIQRVLFLFDEPASNLHAMAQQQLLESFSEISEWPNALIFSTHSHYMINPLWLERAYVVKNDAIDYLGLTGERSSTSSVSIQAERYRKFVSESGDSVSRMSYYQPVLDRLDVKPSQLDTQSECIVVEGKSDFHILSYEKANCLPSSAAIVPAMGATTMRPLIGILRGWASRFLVLLDGDTEGKSAKKAYEKELDLTREIRLLSEIDATCKEIEDVFEDSDLEQLRKAFSMDAKPKKKDLSRLFQEANASKTKLPITATTLKKLKAILQSLNDELSTL